MIYKEGNAKIKFHTNAFLNPKAMISRDISVAVAKTVLNGNRAVLDATAATGIRGIRYALETNAKRVVFLEMNSSAYKDLKKNIKYNKVKTIGEAINKDFQEFANTSSEKFEIIDIDPFGGATPYIFDSMKLVRDSSYLFVTTTDTAVLCGAHRNACLKLYDAVPINNEFCHEAGIRILLGYIARVAAQFNYGILPVVSIYYAHYLRVFIKLEHGARNALSSLKELGYVYYCDKCGNRKYTKGPFSKQQKCIVCGSNMLVAGRLWLGNIHNKKIARKVYRNLKASNTSKKSKELMYRIVNEIDIPFYYSIPKLTKKLGIGSVSTSKLIKLLSKLGNVSMTHFEYSAIKTDVSHKKIIECVKSLSSPSSKQNKNKSKRAK